MAVLYKELQVMKKGIRKLLLILLIVVIVVAFLYYRNSNSRVNFSVAIFLSSFTFAFQLLQMSIDSEKGSNGFEKLLSIYSLGKIIFIKCCLATVLGMIVASVFSVAAYLVEHFYSKNSMLSLTDCILEFLVSVFLTYVTLTILSILYLKIKQILIINCVLMLMIMGVISILITLIYSTHALLLAMSICLGCILVAVLFYVLANCMSHDKIILIS